MAGIASAMTTVPLTHTRRRGAARLGPCLLDDYLPGYGRGSVPVLLFGYGLLGRAGACGVIGVQLVLAASGQPEKPSRVTVALPGPSGSIAV